MKKILCIFALCCALVFSGCKAEEMSALSDLTHPYAGEYKCRKLQFGEEDLLGRFEFIKLTLGYFGDFTLRYAEAEGNEGEYAGSYEVKENTITLSAKAGGREKTYEFPYEDGVVQLKLNFAGKLLYAEFSAIN